MSGSFADHFSGVAARYASFRPRYPTALFDFLASLLPASAQVWDCAAGNGQATTDLAERFATVMATDASAEQIVSAMHHPRVCYRVASAEHSGLADHSVDLITVAQAAHWFDLAAFYAEVRRVLRPGGVLALWAYGVQRVADSEVSGLLQWFYAERVGRFWPPQRTLVEDGYRSIPFPFLPVAAPAIVMEADWTFEQLVGYFSTWSAVSRCRKETGQDPIAELAAELARVWGDPAVARRIAWPLSLRVGRLD